jgi:arginyl-tRNA synthetase
MEQTIYAKIKEIVGGVVGDPAVDLSIPEEPKFGHYSTNVAMRLVKARGKKPMEIAEELAREISVKAPKGFFEKIEAVQPGFINFWITKQAIHDSFKKIINDDHYGASDTMRGKIVMVEFTDPNPFKLFHIGHLMSNTIGESFARLFEAGRAKVIRANYQGDVGLHIAMAIWGVQYLIDQDIAKLPHEHDSFPEKMAFLGKAYAVGSASYKDQPERQKEITALNEKIYLRNDDAVNKIYDLGVAWSLAYFETLYQRLGTKFDNYFFESKIANEGVEIIKAHPDVFIPSEGAIVFPGEKYGLHTRVFINSKGLPTYEAKELGLNKKKFELYPLDLSIVVTGNEIIDYFKVLIKAMEFVLPDVAAKTYHTPHGMMRLPSGKMSSRTGDVITAESLLSQIKEKLSERISEKSDLSPEEREAVTEAVAVGAIKYSILKQNPGQDIIFDFDKSLSFEGDSGPYVQYAYARLQSILRKANIEHEDSLLKLRERADLHILDAEAELTLIRKIFEFPEVVARAREWYAPSGLVTYIHKLASVANTFYETTPILKDGDESRRDARLLLVSTAARTIKSGLALLGIRVLEKM